MDHLQKHDNADCVKQRTLMETRLE